MTAKTREQKLLEKIDRAKKDLVALQERRKKEIGTLAYKYGLDRIDNKKLSQAFANIAQELAHESA
jgi:1,2-phenylacetyl-CoA epoxidase catalytic subunit